MKIYLLFIFPVILTIACNHTTTNSNPVDSIGSSKATLPSENAPTSLCFLRVAGHANQDTSIIRLKIDGSDVTGEFKHIPYEKDSRIGTLEGKRIGNEVKALWNFMQEGMIDTLRVELKLMGDHLLQKTYSIDPIAGRQFISDTSRFLIQYNKVDCQ